MKIEQTVLDGVLVVTSRRFGDDRGWFTESWNAAQMRAAGIDMDFVQDNHSFSAKRGTLRGLHCQSHPHAQDKLVRATRGAILDVTVDFRAGSPGFGKWVGVELSAENGKQLLVPKGFLHGFLTLTDDVEVQYKCTDVYAPDCDGGVRWDDPTIGIDWAMCGALPAGGVQLSAKDAVAPLLADVACPFTYEAAQ
ncbi:dTDP-4-dehydrorhamnose 3,5-epimerase [Pseudorhodobacter antarcticus]|uniref:dTDP-4-dehydrorhamnose 3,5-epimerase n=1 Tax=Pseudorhodobacter antarcticus TaxID=1077947 RepID=A0A1H8H0R6_9RHOB|nr:dTDP-4-dehydrorhamnose 3,5-epimerase [Pseudorhodobacter antarcticus]SEN49564.1 dTDP-4-dehydrorhamnose 3,5-epimerase [Pseudorhodobacter antarcticus]